MGVRKMMSEENLPSDFYKNQSAIMLPPLEGVDFVLKNSSIALASEKPFYGGPEENPFYHIESFDLLIDSIKKNGVTEDWLSCKLFPYTLRRDGAKWLRNLPAGSLTSWKDVRGKFLNHFYTEEMTEIVRAKIFGFQQGDCETFREAWERFNELTRSCPHHGFTLERIVTMFYRGLKWDFKSALDAINGENFMEQYPEDGIEMIKKFSMSASVNHRREKKHESLTLAEAQALADIKRMALELLQKEKFAAIRVNENRGFNVRDVRRRLFATVECSAVSHEKVAAPVEKEKSIAETTNSIAQTYKDMSVLEETLDIKHERFTNEEVRKALAEEEEEEEEYKLEEWIKK